MYMVSILSNLYAAQKNVTSNKIQSTNIGSYRSNLLRWLWNLEEYLSSLYSLSTSSVRVEQCFEDSPWVLYHTGFWSIDPISESCRLKTSTLIKQRSEDKISHEEFHEPADVYEQIIVSEKTQSCIESTTNQEVIANRWVNNWNRRRCFPFAKTCRLDKDVNDRGGEPRKGIRQNATN